jgi:hypothetical protein
MATELQQAWRKLIERSWSDEAFRQQLVDDPNKALRDAGVDVPHGVNFVVVENEPARLHLVLPARPGEAPADSNDDNSCLSQYHAAVVF